MRALVPGFKFNLGFSGKYFHAGNEEENFGDDLILGKLDGVIFESRVKSNFLYRSLSLSLSLPFMLISISSKQR